MESNSLPDLLSHYLGSTRRPLRVVQWATGTIGRRALRAVIEHPALTLAGVFVIDPSKSGTDAGQLCGLDESIGVRATDDIDDILVLEADCVLYMPRTFDIEHVSRILASGTDIVTTCGEFHHPPSMDPHVCARVEAACWFGDASIHSTGSSPGFITEAVPLVLTSIQRELRNLTINEYADLSQRNSPAILFDIMGFGRPPEREFDQARLDHLRGSFGPSLRLVGDAIGIRIDHIEASGEFATTSGPRTIAAGTLDAGTVAAQRITICGMHDGRAVLTFRATWHCGGELETDWVVRPTGWHIAVAGDAPLDIEMPFSIPLERMSEVSPNYTANRAVNAIETLCAAPPGIRTVLDLPQIKGTALSNNPRG